MPQRRTNIRVPTPKLQGEDSYVIYRPLKVGEARKMQEQAEQDSANATDAGLRELVDHVVGWNWVDDEGKPLPKPSENPDVLDELTVDEMRFLSDLLLGDEEDRKN